MTLAGVQRCGYAPHPLTPLFEKSEYRISWNKRLGAHKISAKRVMGEGEGGGRLLVGECFTEGALIKLAH